VGAVVTDGSWPRCRECPGHPRRVPGVADDPLGRQRGRLRAVRKFARSTPGVVEALAVSPDVDVDLARLGGDDGRILTSTVRIGAATAEMG
jgi:hypothetical protein